MSNIFKYKHTNEEVSLIHIGKMEKRTETVAIYEVEVDRAIMVMPLSEFNDHYEQLVYSDHAHFTEHN
jgi:hypothetical protein